jgi:hypothetical protein
VTSSGTPGAQDVSTEAPADERTPTQSSGGFRRFEPWIWFVVVHALLAVVAPLAGTGDVTLVYQRWFESWIHGGPLVGVQTDWVYPVLALGPVLGAGALPSAYLLMWLVLVIAIDAVAFRWVTRRDPAAARWWLLMLLALGPVSIGRLDAFAVPLVLIGGLEVSRRPRAAAVLFTIAAWVKVWPAMTVLAAVAAGPRRWAVLLSAVITSALVITADASLGGAAHMASFLGQQAGRGLEFEAPVTTIWLWLGAFGVAHVRKFVDPRLLDVEVTGDGTHQAAATTTWLMVGLVVGVTAVALAAARRNREATVHLLAPLLLTLTLVLIVTDKVGSPQYVTWLAAPAVLGLIADRPRFGRISGAILVLAVLTQASAYAAVLGHGVPTLVMLTMRNAGYVVLLAWAVALLVRPSVSARPRAAQEPAQGARTRGRRP